jgi:FtsH-binding integral membrane protein
MSVWDRQTTVASGQSKAIDQGLRSYMLKIYNMMASGVLLSAVICYFAGTSEAFQSLVLQQGADGRVGLSGIGYLIALAPMGMAFFMMFKLRSMSAQAIQTTFWVYAAVMGLSLFSIFYVYTAASVLKVFLITAGTFGLLSMYGYATKKDLTSWGTFLFVGLWAVFLVSIVNMFLKSSGLDLMLSYVAVALALGLTAYDTQKIKEIYYMTGGNPEAVKRASAMGALNLYFDFIYLFINLLRILGDRR